MDAEKLKEAVHRYENLFWLAAQNVVFFGDYDSKTKNWDDGWHPYINCNDTFYYASADATAIDEGQEKAIKSAFEKYGWDGVVAWCALMRNEQPLKERRTEKYLEARAAIDAATEKS